MATREAPTSAGLQIRRLAYSDLPAVLFIERQSFPAPWSLAMFVLELSKPSTICLAAIDEDGLNGYLVCSRYADVWHLMNVAVSPHRRRGGIARQLLSRLIGRGRGTRLRSGNRTPPRSGCTRGSAFAAPVSGRAITTTTVRML